MKRTLSIVVDDEKRTIGTEGVIAFTLTELLGMAEYLRWKALQDLTLNDEQAEGKGKDSADATSEE